MEQTKCENCGRPLSVVTDTVVSVNDEGGARIVCKNCASAYGHCPMCQHSTFCGFHEDPDPMPKVKVISRQMRQGNATFVQQQQIMNPDRIKKFCIDAKCKCFLDDPEMSICCRQSGYATCTNYCEIEQYKFIEDFPVSSASEN